MHWQEACKESTTRAAYRVTPDARMMIRYRDGSGVIQRHDKHGFVECEQDKLEGFMDWEPVKEYNAN